jgi:PleD family two-component response regulator
LSYGWGLRSANAPNAGEGYLGTTMPFEYMDAKATISCGISEFPADGNARQELISMADKALLRQTNRS